MSQSNITIFILFLVILRLFIQCFLISNNTNSTWLLGNKANYFQVVLIHANIQFAPLNILTKYCGRTLLILNVQFIHNNPANYKQRLQIILAASRINRFLEAPP